MIVIAHSRLLQAEVRDAVCAMYNQPKMTEEPEVQTQIWTSSSSKKQYLICKDTFFNTKIAEHELNKNVNDLSTFFNSVYNSVWEM